MWEILIDIRKIGLPSLIGQQICLQYTPFGIDKNIRDSFCEHLFSNKTKLGWKKIQVFFLSTCTIYQPIGAP